LHGAVYSNERRRLEQLEQRSTGYRFDLERDPQWERASEPGIHAPSELLADFGVDVVALAPHAAMFDWIVAASLCRAFVVLEECVIAFLEHEREHVEASASLASLVTEEAKHVAMFRRYEDVLLAQHDRASFDRWFAPVGERLRERHTTKLWTIPDLPSRHWIFWMHTLFFEEFTLYLDERLQAATGVQPTWLQIHRLHRIEETQHVATDEGYLEALAFDPARARELSQRFVYSVLQFILDTAGISAAVTAVRELGGVAVCKPGGVTQLPFVHHLLTRSVFRRTRRFAPYLGELAHQRAGN
jgi:hypothetical protein